MASQKKIQTLILDTGPIIKNEPSVSTLLAKAENLVTTTAVISEIRDATTRARVETTLVPFLEIKQPSAAAVQFVQDFALKTGDLAVLSRPDVEIIALAYELECEKNGGDWRLRKTPGQKTTNGPPPKKTTEDPGLEEAKPTPDEAAMAPASTLAHEDVEAAPRAPWADQATKVPPPNAALERDMETTLSTLETTEPHAPVASTEVDQPMAALGLANNEQISSNDHGTTAAAMTATPELAESAEESGMTSDSDSEGWITPSNIKRRQLEDAGGQEKSSPEATTMQVATITSDFAMQNVILQINLNLLSPSLQRVKHLKTFVLRCHACFLTTKDMNKQFCPRCGQPALTRVACSTNANGEFKLHLKKNMQWNHRGDRYSIPKPTSGASNGRIKGGGKAGWGTELILAEDQKEYTRAVDQERRDKKVADLMDADYMPAMFSGSGKRDSKPGGRPRVGAGRTVNSRKR